MTPSLLLSQIADILEPGARASVETSSRLVEQMKPLPILFLISFLPSLLSCTSPPKPMPVKEWIWQFPDGLVAQLSAAEASANAYHLISDTSIEELQTDAGAHRIGEMVTEARDKYRHWKSYGFYQFPPTQVILNEGWSGVDELVDWRSPNNGEFIWNDLKCYFSGKFGRSPSYISTSRGQLIFSGSPGIPPTQWTLHEPFASILMGDRISDIPALIGEIKR